MTSRSDEDDLKRKMEELNRQIAAQEKEIAGLLNVEPSVREFKQVIKSKIKTFILYFPFSVLQPHHHQRLPQCWPIFQFPQIFPKFLQV